jgi:hypothetical protein
MSIFSSLSTVFGSEKAPVRAGMAFWDAAKGIELPGGFQSFQYFPEKIIDNRSAEYASKIVPGGSHPIYTFISGGERSISFDAIFTNENSINSSTTFKEQPYSIDIPQALRWVRTATYPTITTGGISQAPPLVVVYFPNSGIGGSEVSEDIKGASSNLGFNTVVLSDSLSVTGSKIIGIMSSANIIYEAFHRDGTPRIVTVSIEIKEVVQTKKDWRFVSGLKGQVGSPYVQSKYKRGMVE